MGGLRSECLVLAVVDVEGLSISQGDLESVDASSGARLHCHPNTQLRAAVVRHDEPRGVTRAADDQWTTVEANTENIDGHGVTTHGHADNLGGVRQHNRRGHLWRGVGHDKYGVT